MSPDSPSLEARGGRPTREAAAALGGRIVEAATRLFLKQGYAAVSMEAIASAAGVSKRTLYARFTDKEAVMQAAVERLVAGFLPAFDADMERIDGLEEMLLATAARILEAALTPDSLALHRLFVAEAGRFPELGALLAQSPARIGMQRLARRLASHGIADPGWAAEQFLYLVLTGPQRRALGLGPAISAREAADWGSRAVAMFLGGVARVG